MKHLKNQIQEALGKVASHDAGKKTLISAGFAQGKNDMVTRGGVSYVVRSHRMPVTHKGLAIIVDYLQLKEQDRCPNMIFVDPTQSTNTICMIDRAELGKFVDKNAGNRNIMWLTSTKDDPSNPGSSTCMTIPLQSMRGQDWFQEETI